MKLVKNIITIDGPSGVGKGTLAFSLAERLGWNVLDSGLLYRLVGYLSLKDGLKTIQEIVQFLKKSKIKLITNLNETYEPFGTLRRGEHITILIKQTNKKIPGEFLGRLVLGVEDGEIKVFGATIY